MIKPNDYIRYIPTGEEFIVCGVNEERGELIPCGYHFPERLNIADCALIEEFYSRSPQSKVQIQTLLRNGLPSFIDPPSAMLYEQI